jgi:hypothetical protein
MRSTAAVDDLILWHGAAILGLAWLTIAVVSMDGLLAKTEHASLAKPTLVRAVGEAYDSHVWFRDSIWVLGAPTLPAGAEIDSVSP